MITCSISYEAVTVISSADVHRARQRELFSFHGRFRLDLALIVVYHFIAKRNRVFALDAQVVNTSRQIKRTKAKTKKQVIIIRG